MTDQQGKLYLVPTPIGNMGDITARAREVLSQVELIACEDTRHSGALLRKLDIKKRLIAYHEFNERSRADQIAHRISEGESVAVITDGGSPGISDPAYRVVRAAIDSGIEIEPLPGATAIIPALTASGLPTDRFFFEGFLPPKSTARKKRLEKIGSFEHTLVFYESPHRVGKSLGDMLEVLGDRRACLAREISKKFEQFVRGSLSQLTGQFADRKVKGEIVLVVAGAETRKTRTTNE
ncbi:MAG: 16S rRNA (cytidine(1402)-2'-O)-methyltransferase [candidate division Zixibacteria bacterium]|nr:16S rRNA (cytidine(1402)-2'-O)-methyltransferase [candidate division Zixibacteria bacterium]MDH3937300.1 16S rRNA (cytidine(1402)-2'-O)-methyltransferase [candidate division Zixibacteria bacterium]MDH4034556.1 16S rRNA (cytidine(1402)-2'-O)-methyltransferase [candidate division Zixibacteria bacterium]